MGLFSIFNRFFQSQNNTEEQTMKKYLIVGLGNIGEKYVNTRHNVGFKIVEALAQKFDAVFQTDKLGDKAKFNYKGRTFILLKPSTFMNLSGKAVRYWMTKENIELENVLVVGDDLSIPFGAIRIKGKGTAAGHNGFQDIQDVLQTTEYARLRFGIGSEFSKGKQVDYVLGDWTTEESEKLSERCLKATEACLSYGMVGLQMTMTGFNGK
jgi:PTH1 family peptidyl-tRNA hydrolase